ncbi:hypothetical protein ABZX90_03115 [Streptomyces sp. NPDC002935]|uniref:hypothetical protein n=1 Tax=unclassified Streptomyces TaxID=2593676 RepID=UPI00331FCC81
MADRFTGEGAPVRPHRDAEVRVSGRWHPGTLRYFFEGSDGRAVAWVTVRFFEPDWPDWGERVAFKRFYRWDSATIRAL